MPLLLECYEEVHLTLAFYNYHNVIELWNLWLNILTNYAQRQPKCRHLTIFIIYIFYEFINYSETFSIESKSTMRWKRQLMENLFIWNYNQRTLCFHLHRNQLQWRNPTSSERWRKKKKRSWKFVFYFCFFEIPVHTHSSYSEWLLS